MDAATATNGFRQGDVISVNLDGAGETVGLTDDPSCVAVLSQTCDVSQSSKHYCLVAPAEQVPASCHKAVLKGRKPLLVPLDDASDGRWTADVGRAFSIKKSVLETAQVVARCAESDHGRQATVIRNRLKRAFGRFPFPDEVHPIFATLEDRLREKTGTAGNLGRVINLIEDVRVSANQWQKPGRHLTLYLIIPSKELIQQDDCDPSWTWNRVKDWATTNMLDLSLDKVCELILANHHDDDSRNDLTSLFHLWMEFGKLLFATLIQPYLNEEVARLDVEVLSDMDMTLKMFNATEALDLQALSDSTFSRKP